MSDKVQRPDIEGIEGRLALVNEGGVWFDGYEEQTAAVSALVDEDIPQLLAYIEALEDKVDRLGNPARWERGERPLPGWTEWEQEAGTEQEREETGWKPDPLAKPSKGIPGYDYPSDESGNEFGRP